MNFRSTRSGERRNLIDAIMQGLAPDGGLYVPEALPRIEPELIRGNSLAQIAAEMLAPYFEGSPLAEQLDSICSDALNFSVPLRRLEQAPHNLSVLELFHGPTAAFKDVGARFLAAVMQRAIPLGNDNDRPLTILVATSGDTGGAVAAAYDQRPDIRVAVLYPKGMVSARQQQQLTCWSDNIRAFEVAGTFDDCQAIVKQAFVDTQLQAAMRMSAANSINLGRLLPQVAYHAAASLHHWRETGETIGAIVPTGNLGNGLACIWARAMGFPIREVVLAANANRTIPDYLATGDWQPRSTIATLASAMDVGDPSNMERLRDLLPDFETQRANIRAYTVDDASIEAQIKTDFNRYGEVWCPHTATGFWAYDQLPKESRDQSWYVCATAHPAKFESIVEPIIGQPVDIPASLAALLDLPSNKTPIAANIDAFRDELLAW